MSTFAGLADSGVRYLALEAGDWIGRQFAMHGTEAVLRFAPHSLAFDANGDVELLRAFERRWLTGGAGP